MWTGLALDLLNIVVGAVDVPGGLLSQCIVGTYTDKLEWTPDLDSDGLLIATDPILLGTPPYPGLKVQIPETLFGETLFPVGYSAFPTLPLSLLNPDQFGVQYMPEMLMFSRTNPVISTGDPKLLSEAFKKVPFMVTFAYMLNETAELADIVFPDSHNLERWIPPPNNSPSYAHPAGLNDWCWQATIRVLEPAHNTRPVNEVLYELADRAGFLDDFNSVLNARFNLKKPYKLDLKKKYSFEELFDRISKSMYGEDHGLDYFRKHGFIVPRKKTLEEAYPRPFIKPKNQIYFEYFKRLGREVKELTEKLSINNWDVSDYHPLPDWKSCPAFKQTKEDHDLFLVNTKVPIHSLSHTSENPYLTELSDHYGWHRDFLINPQTAEKKGLKNGDEVTVDTGEGQRMEGRITISECVHPEVLQITACYGRWAKRLPSFAKDKYDPSFNTLIPYTLERMDKLSVALDQCVRVKIMKRGK
jgi:molybdopterin-containing oxidoreductase family molybdopterin binding subunit